MSDQPISGYRELSDFDLSDINAVKDLEREVGLLWRSISRRDDIDRRWLALAKTHLQEGFMAFVRSVAKPEDVF